MPRLVVISFFVFLTFYLLRLSFVRPLSIPNDRQVKIVGTISNIPYQKGSYQIIKIAGITIKTDRYPGYFYGEKIEVIGSFEARVVNPFLVNYYSTLPTIKKLEDKKGDVGFEYLKRRIIITRGYFIKRLNLLFSSPENGLFEGIILGVKENIPENFRRELENSGTIHLVVASGQNVALLSGVVFSLLLLKLKRKIAVIVTLPTLLSYCLLVGGEPPIVRATIMCFFSLLAGLTGRQASQAWGLVLSAGLMLLASPLILFDIAFQLSFAATAGIIFLYPLLTICLKRYQSLLLTPFLVSLSAQITTLPLLVYYFGTFSLVSLPANILVSPVVGIILILGIPLIVLNLISTSLAQLLAWLLYPLLKWFVLIVHFFASLDWAVVDIGSLSVLWIALWYAVVILIIRIYKRKSQNSKLKNSAQK